DLVPSKEDGAASDQVTVPFVPVDLDGFMSIVIHAESTDEDTGLAGARQACFPLAVPKDWIYTPLPPEKSPGLVRLLNSPITDAHASSPAAIRLSRERYWSRALRTHRQS